MGGRISLPTIMNTRCLLCFASLLLFLFAGPHRALADLEVTGGTNFNAGITNGATATSTLNGTNYGDVTIPGSVTKSFRLKNDSNSAIQLVGLTVSGPAFSMVSGGVGSLVNLGANATRDFEIRFEPTSAGSKAGTVNIVAVGLPVFTFALSGEGIGEPEIVVRGRPISAANYVNIVDGDTTPTSADGTAFGNWDASAGSLTRTFEIENTGTAQIVIDSITVAGNSTAFSISGAPAVVGVGQTQTFSVKFNPVSYGDFLSTVTIQNDDANEDPFTFDVSASGRGSGIAVLGGTAQTQLILNGDDTPSTTQGTDFGTVVAGSSPITKTFKITNIGNEDLVFTSISENSNAFSISSAPAALSRLAPNASTTFNVVLDTSVAGTKYGTVSIVTNDPNDGVFAFDVTAVATGNPEIVVEGEEPVLKTRSNIADNDTSPTLVDGTAFGSRSVADGGMTRTFFIRNTGTALLTIDSITDGSSHFSVGSVPASVGANGEQPFTVTFNPAAIGAHTAVITINNDDANEAPFTFTVSGTGTGGQTEVAGGVNFGTVIANGDTTPSTTDNTDYGTVVAGSASVSRTFRIANRGNANLFITSVSEDGAAWSLTNAPLGVTLTPSATREFNVVLSPTSAGPKSATVTVLTNDPANPAYTFLVSATATGAALLEVEGNPVPGVFIPITNGSQASSTGNGTDFGSQAVSAGPLSRTFRLRNVGSAQLTIDSITEGSPNFSVSNVPAVVGVNQTQTFTVNFDPSSWGAKFANIVIRTNASGEETFTFRVDGVGLAGELQVRQILIPSGLGDIIPDGDTTPSTAEGTQWDVELSEDSGLILRTFEFRNVGNDTLTLAGLSLGASPAWGWESTAPAFPTAIAPGAATQLRNIAFSPVSTGLKTTTVSITLLNSADAFHTFAMSGDVTGAADLEVAGRLVPAGPWLPVSDGATTTTSANGTDFGEVDVSNDSVTRTFQIQNTGYAQIQVASLTENSPHFSISGVPAVVGVNQSQEFTITFNPNSLGQKSTTVTLTSNAAGAKASYTFLVSGFGEGPDIAVKGGVNFAENIPAGDVTPAAVDGTDFGNVTVTGSSVTRTFRIDNTGNDALTVTTGSSSNAAFTLAGLPNITTPIAPGSTNQFTVTFDPSAAGAVSAVITLLSNDPDENPFTFTVEGFGTNSQPAITVSGPTGPRVSNGPAYAMGSRETGGTLTATFTIENTGTGDLTVSDIAETSPVFSIVSAPTAPIPPGGSDDFRVRFQPVAAGTFSSTITITSDAVNTPGFLLSVTATGTAAAPPAAPDIEVYGGRDLDISIASGDLTPRRADGTDLGQSLPGEVMQRTFRIRNAGDAVLSLASALLINDATGNSLPVTVPPSIAAGAFADFTVSLTPDAPGLKNYRIRISSSDADEAVYDFGLKLEVTAEANPMVITGAGLVGNDFELTFSSDPLKTYRIAWSTDLQTWNRPAVLSGIPGDAMPQTYTLGNALTIAGPRAWFRVEEE